MPHQATFLLVLLALLFVFPVPLYAIYFNPGITIALRRSLLDAFETTYVPQALAEYPGVSLPEFTFAKSIYLFQLRDTKTSLQPLDDEDFSLSITENEDAVGVIVRDLHYMAEGTLRVNDFGWSSGTLYMDIHIR